MQLGDLDRRIRVEQCTFVADSWGQRVPVWSTLTDCWAMLAYDGGDEKFEADQKVAVRVTKFFVRYNPLYTELLRVLYDGQYYDIRSIENIDRKRFQVLRGLRKDNLT